VTPGRAGDLLAAVRDELLAALQAGVRRHPWAALLGALWRAEVMTRVAPVPSARVRCAAVIALPLNVSVRLKAGARAVDTWVAGCSRELGAAPQAVSVLNFTPSGGTATGLRTVGVSPLCPPTILLAWDGLLAIGAESKGAVRFPRSVAARWRAESLAPRWPALELGTALHALSSVGHLTLHHTATRRAGHALPALPPASGFWRTPPYAPGARSRRRRRDRAFHMPTTQSHNRCSGSVPDPSSAWFPPECTYRTSVLHLILPQGQNRCKVGYTQGRCQTTSSCRFVSRRTSIGSCKSGRGWTSGASTGKSSGSCATPSKRLPQKHSPRRTVSPTRRDCPHRADTREGRLILARRVRATCVGGRRG
jgi:hypothetical protein